MTHNWEYYGRSKWNPQMLCKKIGTLADLANLANESPFNWLSIGQKNRNIFGTSIQVYRVWSFNTRSTSTRVLPHFFPRKLTSIPFICYQYRHSFRHRLLGYNYVNFIKNWSFIIFTIFLPSKLMYRWVKSFLLTFSIDLDRELGS